MKHGNFSVHYLASTNISVFSERKNEFLIWVNWCSTDQKFSLILYISCFVIYVLFGPCHFSDMKSQSVVAFRRFKYFFSGNTGMLQTQGSLTHSYNFSIRNSNGATIAALDGDVGTWRSSVLHYFSLESPVYTVQIFLDYVKRSELCHYPVHISSW